MRKFILIVCMIIGFNTVVNFTQLNQLLATEQIVDREKLVEEGANIVLNLQSGKFDKVIDTLDEQSKKIIDAPMLKTTWDNVVSLLGEYIENESISGEVVDNSFVVTVIERYEHTGLKVQITFTIETGKVSALYFQYVTMDNKINNDILIEEAITIVADEKFPLSGILTVPKNIQNPPVVIMVQGSGATDKNETIYLNTPFKDIAYGLAEKGIATLRYDKRFYTYPMLENVTLREEVLDDVNAGIELLRADNRIDSNQIYVLGHSLGGGLAPAIAKENADVKGLIIIAGTPRPIYEVSYDQNKQVQKNLNIMNLDDLTLGIIREQLGQIENDINVLRGDLSAVPDEQILLGLPASYQKSAKMYSAEEVIGNIDIPILVLQGNEDFQVNAEVDFVLWQTLLGDRENASFILYEGLNHLMMHSSGLKNIDEYKIKGEVSKQVINDIASFINAL
ncbi:MAG: hypothetical protein BEN19_03860 [Epulopiscium sp. Nuni2H_MBin003]|nr:MAG: hypothetical protein BEN19_03860 [Epulopiscium sp. Nuni2H_MBin003]